MQAPDACYRPLPRARVRQRDNGIVNLTVTMRREAGICAQVISPVTFVGETKLTGPVRRVNLRLRDVRPETAGQERRPARRCRPSVWICSEGSRRCRPR